MRYSNVKLDSDAQFRLKILDSYNRMLKEDGKVNVRKFCRVMGISKSWFYKWQARYNKYNLASLQSLSRKPKNTRIIGWNTVIEICDWKRQKRNKKKSHYYLYQLWLKEGKTPSCSPKTIYNWWKRRGLIEQRHKRKRRKTKLFNNAKLPGELVQVDVKHLTGRKYQYTAIDVVTRWRFALGYSAYNMQNSIDFVDRLILKARVKGFNIKLIQTDNGAEFQSDFTNHLKCIGTAHQYIWVHTPDQNGKVERSHKTDDDEFYTETEINYSDLDEVNQKLTAWISYYNTKRLHFALNFDTPEEYLAKFKVSTI